VANTCGFDEMLLGGRLEFAGGYRIPSRASVPTRHGLFHPFRTVAVPPLSR